MQLEPARLVRPSLLVGAALAAAALAPPAGRAAPRAVPEPPAAHRIFLPAAFAERAVRPRLVGQSGGASYALDVHGRHAFVGVGPRLAVIDVSDARRPRRVGLSGLLPGVVRAVAIEPGGRYAHVIAGGHLVVVALDDLRAPWPESAFYIDRPRHVAVRGKHVFVTNHTSVAAPAGLHVLDVHDHAAPRRIAFLEAPGGYPGNLEIVGDLAYVAERTAGLWIVDVAAPHRPATVGALHLGRMRFTTAIRWAVDLDVVGDLAYVVGEGSGGPYGHLTVVDVADPTRPRLVGDVSSYAYTTAIAVHRGVAYVAGYAGRQLAAFDVADPASPRPAGSLPLAVGTHLAGAVMVAGGRLFVTGDELEVWDLGAAPADPQDGAPDGRLALGGPAELLAVEPDRGLALVSRGNLNPVSVHDLAEPGAPPVVGRGASASGRAVASDGHLYSVRYGDLVVSRIGQDGGIEVVARGRMSHAQPSFVVDIAAGGGRAAVLYGTNGRCAMAGCARLRVLDVSDPARPREVRDVDLDPSAADPQAAAVGIVGDTAWVLSRFGRPGDWHTSMLQSVALGEVTGPYEVDFFELAGGARAMTVDGTTGYLAGSYVWVVDLADPLAPRFLGRAAASDEVAAVALAGEVLYAVVDQGGRYGVELFDVSDPGRPRSAGVFGPEALTIADDATQGPALREIAAHGDHLLVADGETGLLVFGLEGLAPGAAWGAPAAVGPVGDAVRRRP